MGAAPIAFVQDLLGRESPSPEPSEGPTTGVYTQLVDDVAREITLNTENALYEERERYEGVREGGASYPVELEGWCDFVVSVLPWLAGRVEDVVQHVGDGRIYRAPRERRFWLVNNGEPVSMKDVEAVGKETR